jgi:TldD protein
MAHVPLNPAFLALPLDLAADAGLSTATSLGASWAEFRVCLNASNYVNTHDSVVENSTSGSSTSLGVRVLLNGVWGFASDPSITPEGARRAARSAIELAKVAAPLTTRKVELGPSGPAVVATWNAPVQIDPLTVDPQEIGALLARHSDVVLRNGAEHVDAYFWGLKDTRFYADTHGNRHTQQRIFTTSELTGTRPDADGNSVTLRTLAQPVARGWEWMIGDHYNWDNEISELGALLEQKAKAPLVTPGRYDLVIDPTQLWLTIHESIGHATELDRILGFEANYAGTTFVKVSDLNTLQYGSKLLNVTADRNTPYGLATVAFDDEGIPTHSFPLVTDGTLVGVQADRGSAQLAGLETTGCAYAEDADHVPIQRMPNISMQPAENGRRRAEIIADVEDGLLVIGDDSWSIDMQRKNFQFTGQQFWRIRNGELDGMVRNAAYQSTTPQFWNSLTEVGGPETYILHGALNCGKGQPGQSAPVGHGAPVARFNQIDVLNTTNNDDLASHGVVTV